MSNTRNCIRCKRRHWRDAKLCNECADDDARKMMRAIIDRNRAYEAGAGRDADHFFNPDEDKREPR
jgi:hypothetical protein